MDRLVWPWWSSVQVEGGNSWQSWRLTLIGWFWLVSENHSAASAAFREPLLCSPANSSNRSRLVHYVPNMDSGTDPYPLVVVITFCSARWEVVSLGKASIAKVLLSRCVFSARTRTAQHRSLELKNPAPRPFNRPPSLRAATPQGRSTNPSTTSPKLAPHSPSTTPCSGVPPSSKW